MQISEIKLIREFYIKKLGACESKIAGVFAIPDRPHFKTGKIVVKILEIDNGINILSYEALEYVYNKLHDDLSPNHDNLIIQKQIDSCLLADYSLQNKLRLNTQRGLILARNLAIKFIQLYGVEKAKQLMKVFERVQITTGSEWISWAINNKKTGFACGELRNWLRNTQSCDVEELTCWRCKYGKSK